MKTTLKLSNIIKSFTQAGQTTQVIKGISLEIQSGELVALTGPSGSGKTTLLQIAGLLDASTSGKIEINEIDVSKANDAKRTEIRKNNIGFVYQFHHLLPEFSALENVALPLLVQKKDRDEAFSEAKKLLDQVGLQERYDYKPSQLSGGQQQRVAIARAIITKPSLILADEPTGNLDSELSAKIFDLLLQLVKEYKISCLVVTHNLELANKSDRVISIKDGIIS